MKNISVSILICLVWVVSSAPRQMTRAERLARRRQSRAYQRAMTNLSIQFINDFLAEQPPAGPPVKDTVRDFDPSGLGDETHFSLLWLLPGFLLSLLAITLYLAVSKPKAQNHHHYSNTDQSSSPLV